MSLDQGTKIRRLSVSLDQSCLLIDGHPNGHFVLGAFESTLLFFGILSLSRLLCDGRVDVLHVATEHELLRNKHCTADLQKLLCAVNLQNIQNTHRSLPMRSPAVRHGHGDAGRSPIDS